MALNTFKSNCLTTLHFKGLTGQTKMVQFVVCYSRMPSTELGILLSSRI